MPGLFTDEYKPASMEGELPATLLGQLLSLADKADTLASCFSIGLIPKGSSDPFALRRAAQGIVRILAEGEAALSLEAFYGEDASLLEFFKDRVRYYYRDVRGYSYDEVSAAMAAGFHDLKDTGSRLQALREVRPTKNFEPIAANFKRIQNILEAGRVSRRRRRGFRSAGGGSRTHAPQRVFARAGWRPAHAGRGRLPGGARGNRQSAPRRGRVF
ncbi:MAG: glycine--tRNA ligase subunit beta [Bryobacterales bacterium]|nr:glycine--tRNA ligase subunit beta [Bryobacterales bacterium]